jgi:uncharacterized membrane protein YkoI
MLRLPLTLVLTVLAAGTAAAAEPAHAPKARLTLAQARTIALHVAPGRIISAEYEKEGGGWRYSFDIQQRGHVQEIGVDGMNGRIIENKSEGKVDHD